MAGSFYHFTCDHGHPGIVDSGVVKPNRHPLLGIAVAWFTDLEAPDRDTVGLTSETGLITCDRLAYRFAVTDAKSVRPWLGSIEQSLTAPAVQAQLHMFSKPSHWFISRSPVPVEEAPVGR